MFFFFVLRRFNIGFIFENLYLFWSTYLSCFYFGSGFWCFTAPKMPVVFKLLLDKLLPKVAHGDLKTENFFIAFGISGSHGMHISVGFALFSQASAPENRDFCGPQNGRDIRNPLRKKNILKGLLLLVSVEVLFLPHVFWVENEMSPRFVSFQWGWFSTSMILGEKGMFKGSWNNGNHFSLDPNLMHST